jgi:hypothetical protein
MIIRISDFVTLLVEDPVTYGIACKFLNCLPDRIRQIYNKERKVNKTITNLQLL